MQMCPRINFQFDFMGEKWRPVKMLPNYGTKGVFMTRHVL